MVPAPTTRLAREYLRVSVDRAGAARSPKEQHAENLTAAAEHSLTLGEPYQDDDRSASRYARKSREGFDRLMDDLERDRFGAEVLVLWESSRGSRKEGEWITLLDWLEERRVQVFVTTHDRLYDPTNGRDRKALLEDAVDSAYESWKISVRTRRSHAARAAEGRPHGRTPFGYVRRYDPVTRALVAQEPEPAEAKVVRELFERVAKGHSVRGIAVDFEARGIRRRSGQPWTPQDLRPLLTARAYIGERVHGDSVTPAQWPALVPRSTFFQVQQILSDPTRLTRRPGRGKHLLSMLGRCDICSGPIVASNRRAMWQYACRVGHVRVDKADLDDLAEKVMLGYLARPDVYEALAAHDDSTELEEARGMVAQVQSELDDLAAQLAAGTISATLAARAEPGILTRLQAARDAEAALSTPPRLRGLIAPGADVERRWTAAPMSTRREVARILLAPELLGELRVVRSPAPGHPVPVEDRVAWRRSQ